jgi:thioredoxin-related protein
MKHLFLGFLFLTFIVRLQGQEVGMNFEHNTTWDNVLAKAKKENKYIFVDCYTTWCGPCKTMSKDIFPKEEVGKFYNQNFVNLKIQMDVTKDDNEDVKSWYTSAKEIEKKYTINAYPTYLIFSPSGEIVHRLVGSMDETKFIENGKIAINPETQYYTLKNQYESQKGNPAYLYKMLNAALDAYEVDFSKELSKAYFATQKDMYTKDNLNLLVKTLESTNDAGFIVLAKNPSKVDAILGKKGMANSIMKQAIMNDIVYPAFKGNKAKSINWTELENKIKAKAPSLSKEVLLSSKIMFAQKNKNWKEFSALATNYIKTYGNTMSDGEVNSLAWTIFENCNDMACITATLNYSKKTFAENNNPMYIDTYANLLHKAGKTEEAIVWQNKAIELVKKSGEDSLEYEATLDKMKKGEKTWQ